MFGFIDLIVLMILIFLFRRSAKRYDQNRMLWMLFAMLSFIIGYLLSFLLYTLMEGLGIEKRTSLIVYMITNPIIEILIGLLALELLKRKKGLKID